MNKQGKEREKQKKRFIPENFEIQHVDYSILLTAILLSLIGVIMVYSASYHVAAMKYDNPYYYALRQLIWTIAGFVILFFATNVPLHWWVRISVFSYVVVILLLIMVYLNGDVRNGAKRWIWGMQPSEMMKIAIVLLFAHLISRKKEDLGKFKNLIKYGLLLALPIGLIYLQPNLSMVIVITFGAMAVLFVASPHLRYFKLAAVLVVVLALAVLFKPGQDNFRLGRIQVWVNPFQDAKQTGYQTVQSLYAVGSGGLFGLGLGQSHQKYGYIPEAHNDIIFAVLVEELGVVGAALVLILFLFLIYKGYQIAINAPNKFASLTAVGITSILALQVLVNVAVVTNSMPVTGVTLPFISYGGSSILVIMTSIGILLNISRYKRDPLINKKTQLSSDVRPM